MSVIYIVILAVAIVVLWLVGSFNSLVRSRNRVRESWADIDVQLKRRYDLIPNLVETVKGYAAHEREVFERVIKARSAAMEAKTVAEHGEAENMLSGALKSLLLWLRLIQHFALLKISLNYRMN